MYVPAGMIAWIVFVLVFLAIGLAVIFFAMSGGPRGMRAAAQTQHRTGRKVVMVIIGVVIVLIGVAVPVAVGFGNANQRQKDIPGGPKLTDSQERGRVMFSENCATCHTLRAANAVGMVGPNLDVLHPPKALVVNAVTYGRARGQGQMPAGLLQGRDLQDVAAFVAVAAGR
jgi:heme/copper-type cytochrome/quinol oxidase subunit 2